VRASERLADQKALLAERRAAHAAAKAELQVRGGLEGCGRKTSRSLGVVETL